MRKLANKIANNGVAITKRIIEENHKVATGQLLNSIQSEIRLLSQSQVYIEIFSALPKSHNIINGRRAMSTMPPADALEAWLKAKHIVIRHDAKINGRSYRRKSGNDYERDLQRTLFLIRRHIGKKGIPPFNYVELSVPPIKEMVESLVKERVNLDYTGIS
jgi:hypothetical protein